MSRKLGIFFLFISLWLVLSALPAAAQSGVVWTGDYFNNGILQAPASLTRTDSAIAFDWGAGSPAQGINPDNFSIRWAADPFFTAGTYRFWVLADDGVRVFVDLNPIPLIDTINQGRAGQIVSADLALGQGNHRIQVDYQELGGNAFVYFTWANLATNPAGPNFPAPSGPLPPVSSGPWTAQYFANPSLFGTPTLIQTESSPSHDWGTGSPVPSLPADNFSARWTSSQFLDAGTYQISVRADDGVRVAVNGITYINQFTQATGQTYTATVTLTAGQHNFLIEYFEAGGVAFLNYTISRVGSPIITTPIPPVVTGARAIVTGAFRLNVRNAPDPINGAILTKINRNETYPVVGRNANSTWWQINVNGVIGWVNARFVTTYDVGNVPISGGSQVVPTATPGSTVCTGAPAPRLVVGRLGRVTAGGAPNNIRQQPGTNNARIGQIPPTAVFSVLAGPQCAGGLYWWQVNYNGIVGWTAEGRGNQYWIEPAS